MTPLFCRKKRYFSTTSMLRNRYFGFPPLHKKANKVLQGGVSLPFIGSLRVYALLKEVKLKKKSWHIIPNKVVAMETEPLIP